MGVAAHAQTRDLSLDEALALATKTSESAEIARAGVERAEANVARTNAQRLPQINGSASYQRTLASQFSGISDGGDAAAPPPECTGTFTPDPSLPLEQRVAQLEARIACPAGSAFSGIDFNNLGFGAPNTWNIGASFNWTVFTFGRLESQVAAAAAARNATRIGLGATEAQTRLDVTQAYFDAQLAAQLVDIAEQSLANSEETLRLTDLRAREGAQAEFDVLQARVTRDNQRPVLIRRRTQRELAFDRLRALLDLPPNETLRLTTPVTSLPETRAADASDAAVDAVVDTRIPVQQARERINATKRLLDAARAERFPAISVQSQYGLVSFSESFLPEAFRKNWTVGAALSVPIYDGGRITADIRSARADLAEAQAQLDQLREFARLDTESALAELRAALAAWEATEGTVEQAQRGYELAKLRYQEGVSIPLEIENARLLLDQARANRAQAARDVWIAQTRAALLPFLPLGAPTTGGTQP